MKTPQTNLEILNDIFPEIEIYKNYFSKLKSSNKTYVNFKKLAVFRMQNLRYFGVSLTQNEIGSVVGSTRWNVAIILKELPDYEYNNTFKKCLKNNIYPVSTKGKEEKKKYGTFKMVEL